MVSDSAKIEFVEGQAITPRRGIAFLSIGERHVDGKEVFDSLDGNIEKFVMTSMKAWVAGSPDIPTRFHGFAGDPTFQDGYVFKWRDDRVQHRIYGFKMRPGVPNERFEVCVLVMHSTKNTQETDPWIKNAIGRLRDDEAIRKTIMDQVKKMLDKKEQPKGRIKK